MMATMRAARPIAALYDRDFLAWCEEQAAALRDRRTGALDLAHLAQQVADRGGTLRRALRARLATILQHMLKRDHQAAQATRSWHGTIARERVEIERLIEQSPSLRPSVPEALDKAYADARRLAAAETGIDATRFPKACPYALAEILGDVLGDAAGHG